MIVVRVELHSAVTHRVTELARMEICNVDNARLTRRNYLARVLRGRSQDQLDKREVHRAGEVRNWPSERLHIWNLVAAALTKIGYGEARAA